LSTAPAGWPGNNDLKTHMSTFGDEIDVAGLRARLLGLTDTLLDWRPQGWSPTR
jgi:hypothetical protein